MVWLVILFDVIIGRMCASLDQAAESTAKPFQGGGKDVPISEISRTTMVELREMLREKDLSPLLEPVNGIAT